MDLREEVRQQLLENQNCGCDRRKDLWNKWLPYNSFRKKSCKEPCN